MSRIFRYSLEVTDRQTVDMPFSYRLLSVAPGRVPMRYDIDVWAIVPEVAPMVPVVFRIFGTGHPLPHDVSRFTFIGTVVMGDNLVWHCFEEPDVMRHV